MKKITILSFILGCAVGYLLFISLDEISRSREGGEDMSSHEHIGMMHELQDVTSESVPTLDVVAYPDAKSGYNVQIITSNFTWTPEDVNNETVQNEGHAHIYVNGEKVARVYGEWFHVDDHHLQEFGNVMRVTLNANDHAEWSLNGDPIEVIINLD